MTGDQGRGLAAIVAESVLLVSAFLPWVDAQVVLSGPNRRLTGDLGSTAGVNVDGTGQLVPVLAVIAICMTAWSLLAGTPRIAALAAVPGALALLSCGVFLLRLDRLRDELVAARPLVGYDISLAYGWFTALAATLLVTGVALVGPVSAPRPRGGAQS